MEGRTVSHYRIRERLGGGGMGMVYKATDERLGRTVALKFLPPDLTRDDEARQRLIQEAKTASSLDHPNICTIHDIDSTPEGQLFIAMAFYNGETLKKRIARGPLAIQEVIDFSMQVAHGLAKAHEAGIIHRDIKPANLMVTRDGVVKIVDFGIAKLTAGTNSTRTNTIIGTAAYMSPEQINGETVDRRTDIWSTGVVIYEMLAGKPPFRSEHPLTLMNEIATHDPVPVESLRSDVPEDLAQTVARAMRKARDERQVSGEELAQELGECWTKTTLPVVPNKSLRGSLMRPKAVAAGLIVLICLGAAAGWFIYREVKYRWARQQIIPEISRLVEQDKYGAAFALARQVEPYLAGDPVLQDLWPRISRDIAVTTRPPGARVYTRDYADGTDQWHDLGVTPLQSVRVPFGLRRWRFEKAGTAIVEIARGGGGTLDISLDQPADSTLVHVSGGDISAWITGIDPIEKVAVPDFFIERYEVTNRQFKSFLAAGGYRKREYWDHSFVDQGAVIPWESAMDRFVDPTGRPGPSTWTLGDYPPGQDDYPVSGVSWYEAAAFAKFSGKSLPTVPHWIRAAGTDLGADIEPLSNLQGTAPAPVGKYRGMSPFGAYDMAGNVREWCYNAWGDSRFILGGAWMDPPYMFTYANVQAPFDRSPTNGIRLVRYIGAMPEAAGKPVELLVRDYAKEKPVSVEVFNVYRGQFTYDVTPLNAVVEEVSGGGKDCRVQKVTFVAAYGRNKAIAYVFLPTSSSPPYQAVLVFPGSTAISASSVSVAGIASDYDFILKSGRALVLPVYRGTYERREGLTSTWPDRSDRYRELAVSWVRDAKRTIDYLETRSDIDVGRLAYLGFSWGGRMGAIVPAVEPRIKAVILKSGGLASGWARPEIDQLNYVGRVTQPVLMLNGRFDAIEPVEHSQRPMFDALGTAKELKKWIVYEDGHAMPSHRNEVAREALAWLDRYLGRVN